MPQAIETKYKGCRFRSRTEARWAVFFDTLRIDWEYEAEGYKLSDGTCYLPDFKLLIPNQPLTFCEVKGGDFDSYDDEEMHQRWVFANDLQARIILLNGAPKLRIYDMIPPGREFRSLAGIFFKDYDGFIGWMDNYWMQQLDFNEATGELSFNMDERRAGKAFGTKIPKALEAAKSARFEHGETPQIPD